MRFVLIALVLAASAAGASRGAGPAPASKPPAAQSPSAHVARPADWEVRVQRGILLAKTAQPEDEVVKTALDQLDANFVPMIRSSPQLKDIEDQYPGFSERYYAAARPVLARLLKSRLPNLWQGMAEAYATEMTPQQIDGAAAFYRGPLGQKVIRGANERMNVKPMLETSLRQGLEGRSDAAEAKEQLESATNKAALTAIASLPAADRSRLVQFLVSPTGKAMRRVGPAISDVLSKWMTADDPAAEAEMGEVAMGVLADMQAAKEGASK